MITVELAMKRAWNCLYISLSPILIPLPVLIYFDVTGKPMWLAITITILSIVSMYFLQVILGQKWSLWAFTNVDDVHELRKNASFLFPIPDEKYGFETTAYKEKRLLLQRRFDEPAETMYLEIPDEGLLFKRSIFRILFVYDGFDAYFALLVYITINLILFIVNPLYGTFALIIILLFVYHQRNSYMRLFNNDLKLEIDKQKIVINGVDTYFWGTIRNEDIILFSSGRGGKTFLIFDYNNEEIRIPLDYYKINQHRLKLIMKSIRKINGQLPPPL